LANEQTSPVIGVAKLGNTLRKLARDVPGVVAAALYEEAKIEMREAKRRTPVETGALRDSGLVYKPMIDGSMISCTMTFGVPDPYYAIYVHEDLEAHHDVGEAKFLESTLLESAPYMARRIKARIDFDRWGTRG
jgi:Bacteriophage protein of unknown function (DUF646).